MTDNQDKQKKLAELEALMAGADFWADKNKAQAVIREMAELKAEIAGAGKYDSGDAVLTIMAGAGGIDAEDFARMLFEMYQKFFNRRGFSHNLFGFGRGRGHLDLHLVRRQRHDFGHRRFNQLDRADFIRRLHGKRNSFRRTWRLRV